MAQFIYGKNVVNEAIKEGIKIHEVYLLNDDGLVEVLKKNKIKYSKVDKKYLDKLSNNQRHQGVIAKVDDYKLYDVKDFIKKENGLIVILDELEDPHNLGAILRTCDATNVDGVIIKKRNAVGLTPTVAKASAGAINTVKVSSVVNISRTIEFLKENNYWIIGTDMDNAIDYRTGKYDMNIALVIGNEGKGVSSLVKKNCDFMIKLPMNGKIQSLNASVATGILLYEIYNKRFPLKG